MTVNGGRKQVNAKGAKVDVTLDDMRITNRSLGNVRVDLDVADARALRRRRDPEWKVTPASKGDATPKVKAQIGEPSADYTAEITACCTLPADRTVSFDSATSSKSMSDEGRL